MSESALRFCSIIWDKVFKNGLSRMFYRLSSTNFTWPILEYLEPSSSFNQVCLTHRTTNSSIQRGYLVTLYCLYKIIKFFLEIVYMRFEMKYIRNEILFRYEKISVYITFHSERNEM